MEISSVEAAFASLFQKIGILLERSQPVSHSNSDHGKLDEQPSYIAWTKQFADEIDSNHPLYPVAQLISGCQTKEKLSDDQKQIFQLVKTAALLSAGETESKQKIDSQQNGMLILSIFDRIGSDQIQKDTPKHYLPLTSIALTKNAIFPGSKIETDSKKSYAALSEALKKTLQGFTGDPETDLEKLLSSYQQNTWSVPATGQTSLADVSFYDHSRSTAAIAVCLKEKNEQQLFAIEEAFRICFQNPAALSDTHKKILKEPTALLVGGDISGIQNFIYTVPWNMAAKSLRGRSFYLQLLTEAVLRFVLNELEIPYTNVIYSGGGHFYLLAPVTSKAALHDIQRKITQKIYRHHQLALYLSLGFTEIPLEGFQRGSFSNYWDQLQKTMALQKQRRYLELGESMYEVLFQPEAHGGNQEHLCSVCGVEKSDVRIIEGEEIDADTDQKRICQFCNSLAEDLGSKLPHAHAIRFFYGEPEDHTAGSFCDALAEFGMGFALLDQNGKTIGDPHHIALERSEVTWIIDDNCPMLKPEPSKLPSVSWRHDLVNIIPKEPYSGAPIPFDEIQQNQTVGIKRLGVLRMDVDDMGKIFKEGFGTGNRNIATLSRLSALSFQLSLFFEGYLKTICQESGDSIYSVYSGGDDLFLIGPWQVIPSLAQRIRSDFSDYTCNNPAFHISGGMTFIHGKYPIIQAADDAGEALEKAKQQLGKDAFTFLDEAWKWNEFPEMERLKNRLVDLDVKGGPRSLLQMLQQLDEQKKNAGTRKYGRWLWLGEYQLTRMRERYKKEPEIFNEIQAIQEEIRKTYYANLHTWAKAARWAQLELRNENQ